MKPEYDILIVGAGIVGSSLALALSALPLRIGLIEQFPFNSLEETLSLPSKPIALNLASLRILKALKVWPALEPYANPIFRVKVSQQGYFGQLKISAEELGVPQLGAVIPAARLGMELIKALCRLKAPHRAQGSLDLYNPATCVSIHKPKTHWQVVLQTFQNEKKTIHARLIIAADGTDSTVRTLLKIGLKMNSTVERALMTFIESSRHHQHHAYQRFTQEGIIACLPLRENKIGLVWTSEQQTIETLQNLMESEFLERVQQHFSYRFGKLLNYSKPQIYSLKKGVSECQAQAGLLLLGNAAHTLLPIAAQGLNLGLYDMAECVDVITNALKANTDLGDKHVAHAYLQARVSSQQHIIRLTERLKRLQPRFGPLTFIYNNGLLTMDLIPRAKRNLSHRLMGTHGRLPRLVRGLTLQQEEYEYAKI
ncbi:FAD-dependent monooxygenase [Rickettsiella grylli]|uniref:Ubiquinone biosynthesis hydroxylase, UbiH/UbiF/VisC/COQ6 n=1 Tax=Rickettsiella grylli TaxID=59196 RepID=A8PLI2_9COXI|nr:FAD-dependent monooxygenase [Rickettsiella grylli]EDP47034.1 ubiquinone biosynthesis hydroxylase, UbiH/UbiF/VisC/COQ6 [Rickettsiella grylli]